ncbi:hypothetical protein DKX38_007774 [Salix brachista]|uniref:Uncharacterized protein n=1 Tax=Salix brachista TaxID=2182728 RepID=A0A5N5MNW0_9ROSI|nr:hypothetical protein DKX38_007774 [Salix brachista]
MGLFSMTIAGSGFILIGAWESLTSSTAIQNWNSVSNPSSALNQTPKSAAKRISNSSSSSVNYITVTIFSLLFIVNSLISLFNAVDSRDRVGSALQLQILAVAALFFLYSFLGLLSNFSSFVRFPSSILNLIVLFAFVEEFLLFYMQRKDPSGIENRYFDLMLVPILICVVSTTLELKSPWKSNDYPRLARGVGLILQGMWIVQMGLSFYTNLIVHGCSLHEKSRGNYSIKCKGHPEYHRARGIATLQFNCHLALLVIFAMSVYSVMAKNNGAPGVSYKPLGAEMQQMENHGQFTLDSDDDEIREDENVTMNKGAVVAVNGNLAMKNVFLFFVIDVSVQLWENHGVVHLNIANIEHLATSIENVNFSCEENAIRISEEKEKLLGYDSYNCCER